jgi:hypothetical protein
VLGIATVGKRTSALSLCLPAGAALALAACATVKQAAPPPPAAVEVVEEAPSGWRAVAKAEDVDRIARLDAAWSAALTEARSRRFKGAVADEGELLDPAAALPRAAPPPGPYKCRVIKLGTQRKGGVAYNAYAPFFCYVEAEGDLLTIVKQTGSQRPAGRLYPEKDERLVFLGTLALGDEEAPLPYGERPERDMAGVVERVAPFRWRLVIPWPRTESKLDVIELVPVAS